MVDTENQGFGSATFYPADLDSLGTNPPEILTRFKFSKGKSINNAFYDRILANLCNRTRKYNFVDPNDC